MNKKGIAQMFIFLIVIAVLLALLLGIGGISGFLIKKTFEKIPVIFWIGLGFFILLILGRKKR